MEDNIPTPMDPADLRRRAEDQLGKLQNRNIPDSEGNKQRLLHELQVHQIQLEMQNTELANSRDRTEALLEKFTDLYDFSPVGYITLDETGLIHEVNLTGAIMLGIERTFLLKRKLSRFVAPNSRAQFEEFLTSVFNNTEKQICELELINKAGVTSWVDLQGTCTPLADNSPRWCRLAISDITALKRAAEVKVRFEALQVAALAQQKEIDHRKVVEKALRKSERKLNQSLEEERQLQTQLRLLPHRLIEAQEKERKRISRDLHDDVVQSLVSISVKLERLTYKAAQGGGSLRNIVDETQQQVTDIVDTVHRFARELRPAILDDLGLVSALRAHIDEFTRRTNIKVHLDVDTAVNKLSQTRSTVLYRVVQSALNNITQHARATEVHIVAKKLNETICMTIQDNGISFDVKKILQDTKYKRLGLIGMRERAEMVGGAFSITSLPGEGTTIQVTIPTTEKRRPPIPEQSGADKA